MQNSLGVLRGAQTTKVLGRLNSELPVQQSEKSDPGT